MINNLVGPPVIGKDFVGRESEYKEAAFRIESGNSLLLASPRRVGKSSFAHRLIDGLKDSGWKGLYIDLQGIRDEKEFADCLMREFSILPHKNRTSLKMRHLVGRGLRAVRKVNIKDVGMELNMDRLDSMESIGDYMEVTGHCIVVLDELAVFLQELVKGDDFHRAEILLNWLRKMRQRFAGTISWVYCSSVSILNFCSQNNVSYTINDMQTFELGELSEEESRMLLTGLDEANGFFDSSQIDYVLDRIGWKLPFFIQLFYSRYRQEYERLAPLKINQVMDVILADFAREQMLNSWSERLKNYGKDEVVARALLNYLAQPGANGMRGNLESVISQVCRQGEDITFRFSSVRKMLENDGYLMQDASGEELFRSPVIKEYWFQNFVK